MIKYQEGQGKIFTEQEFINRVKFYLELMCPDDNHKITSISISKRMTRGFGYYWNKNGEEHILKFSINLINGKHTLKFVDDTIKHEICHFIDTLDRGESWHDKEFKKLCNKFNCSGDSTVSGRKHYSKQYQESELRLENYPYYLQCTDCGKLIGFNSEDKMLNYIKYYRCKQCKTKFKRVK